MPRAGGCLQPWARTDDPFIIELDMPGSPGVVAGPLSDDVDVVIDPIPSLRHDRRWRRAVKAHWFHNGVLDRLDDFYP